MKQRRWQLKARVWSSCHLVKRTQEKSPKGGTLMLTPYLLCGLTHFCWKHIYALESFSKVPTCYWWRQCLHSRQGNSSSLTRTWSPSCHHPRRSSLRLNKPKCSSASLHSILTSNHLLPEMPLCPPLHTSTALSSCKTQVEPLSLLIPAKLALPRSGTHTATDLELNYH